MQNNNTEKTQTCVTQAIPEPKKPDKKAQIAQAEFKRKYFEFYDDIKISDRQDW